MTGGYVMVDCQGLNLLGGSTPQEISGIYEATKKAMDSGKPMLACNCTWGSGVSVTPVSILAIDFTTEIICTASTLQIHVKPDDTVTVSSLVG